MTDVPMTDMTISRDDIDSMVAKLDGLDVTDRERRLLLAVVRLAGNVLGERTSAARDDHAIDVGSF